MYICMVLVHIYAFSKNHTPGIWLYYMLFPEYI